MEIVRYAERPDVRARRRDEFAGDFPEYMFHNAMGWRYWGQLYERFPELQLAVLDDDKLVGEVHAVRTPVGDELPNGWDEAFEQGMENDGGNLVSLLAISVHPTHRGKGIPALLIGEILQAAGTDVIAPVRPTLKSLYPLTPIERYMEWRRDDGSHFDPWLRAHERVGGVIAAAAPRSMTMEAPIEDWQAWTEMEFPEDGTYVVPGMLSVLEVRDGLGLHIEPNVWVRHSSTKPTSST
jgi:GNAT superfamily N-acetyltransferase